jgi:hypothetical protein
MSERFLGSNMLPVDSDVNDFDSAPIVEDPGNTCPHCGAEDLMEIWPDHTEEFHGISCIDCGFYARIKVSFD